MINLVTGYRGEPHITSDDEAAKNLGLFGLDFFVIAGIGEELDANKVSNNLVRIKSGDAMLQGRHVRITGSEDVTIENGSQGMKRKDLICLRYKKDSGTGVESVSLVVIKGEETGGTAERPSYNKGSILDGDSPVDFPLWEVALNGTSVSTLTNYFPVKGKLMEAGSDNFMWETYMLAQAWEGNKYSFETTYSFFDYDIWIQVSNEATAEHAKAFGAAMIVGDVYSNVYTALGKVPTVDIPIIIRGVAK